MSHHPAIQRRRSRRSHIEMTAGHIQVAEAHGLRPNLTSASMLSQKMEFTSLSDALISLIPIYGPWIIFGIVGNAVVFFRRFIAVLRMFAALLAGANCMPAGRFNMTGGVCWACLFAFGASAVGA